MCEMRNYFKRVKVPKQKQVFSVATSSVSVAQNPPNKRGRLALPPLGQVVASAARESTSDCGLSVTHVNSESVDKLSCSDEKGARDKDCVQQKPSGETNIEKHIRKCIAQARQKEFITFEDFSVIEREETEFEKVYRLSLRAEREPAEEVVSDPNDSDWEEKPSKKRSIEQAEIPKRQFEKLTKRSSKRYARCTV
jgi:hypothetical protein